MFDAIKNAKFQLYLSVACAMVLFFHSLVENLLGISGFVASYPTFDKNDNPIKRWAKHIFYFVKIPTTIYMWTALNTMLFLVLDVAKGEVMSDFSSITFHDLVGMVVGAYKSRLWCVLKNLLLAHLVITAVVVLYARPSKMKKQEGVETMTRVYFVMLLVHAMVLLAVEFVLPCTEWSGQKV